MHAYTEGWWCSRIINLRKSTPGVCHPVECQHLRGKRKSDVKIYRLCEDTLPFSRLAIWSNHDLAIAMYV